MLERELDNLALLELRGKIFCLRFNIISEDFAKDIRENVINTFFLDCDTVIQKQKLIRFMA